MTDTVLGRLALALPLAVAGWLLGTLPLLLAGVDRPLPAVLLGLPVATGLVWAGLRHAPRLDGPRWVGLATLAVVVAFAALSWATSGEPVVLRRDPGSYTLYADWVAGHGGVSIPTGAKVFGRSPAVGYGSPGFYQQGDRIVPQFLPGLPLLLAPAGWLAGLPGVTHANALIAAAALLVVAGLAARVAGPRAGPLAALVVGTAYPVLHAARSPYSEPLDLMLLTGGLIFLVDRRSGGRGAVLGGLLAGLAVLVRIDALADLLPLFAWVPLLPRPRALRIGAGLGIGVGTGLAGGLLLSRPYLATLRPELIEVGAAAVLALGVGFALRRGVAPRRDGGPSLGRRVLWWRRPRPGLAAAAVLAGAVGFWLRPLVDTAHMPGVAWSGMIGALQRQQGVPVDPTRTYAEHALHWLSWWIGPTGVVIAVVGLALLVHRRLARSVNRADLAPFLLVVVAATVLVLWRPSITPDHPWADRRFVPVVLPGLVIAGCWLVVRLPRMLGVLAAAALVVPTVLASAPLLFASTERGELGAVTRLCTALGPRAAVVVTGTRARLELPQTIRGICGVPTAEVSDDRLAAALPELRAASAGSGRRLVLVAESATPLVAVGARAELVVALTTREDARVLTRRPTRTVSLSVSLWTATPPAPGRPGVGPIRRTGARART